MPKYGHDSMSVLPCSMEIEGLTPAREIHLSHTAVTQEPAADQLRHRHGDRHTAFFTVGADDNNDADFEFGPPDPAAADETSDDGESAPTPTRSAPALPSDDDDDDGGSGSDGNGGVGGSGTPVISEREAKKIAKRKSRPVSFVGVVVGGL